MYYDQYFPFYVTSMKPHGFQEEQNQDREIRLMKSYYPKISRIIQEKVEEECEYMDYEGSRMYDEYPDKFMLYHTCRKIRKEVEPELQLQEIQWRSIPENFLDELIQILLYQEMERRRCRRQRCKKIFSFN